MGSLNTTLFISLQLPLLMMCFIMKDRARRNIIFLMFGILAYYLAARANSDIATLFGVDDFYRTTNIAPPVEEILKTLPVLVYVYIKHPKKQDLFELSISAGIGFALIENVVYVSRNVEPGVAITLDMISFAFVRGIATGMMHGLTTLAVGFGMSFIKMRKRLFILATFTFLTVGISYHSIFNTLVLSPYYLIGYFMPIMTFVPLFVFMRKNKML